VAQSRDSLSFDATIGVTAASSGKLYNGSGGISGEVTLGLRLHPERPLTVLGAIGVGRVGLFDVGGDALCVPRPPTAGTTSECAPPFPNLTHVAVLGGVEEHAGTLTLRALAGPAVYAGDGPWFGAQTQLDGAIGFSHLALVAAVRGTWIERETGERFLLRSLEFGLRVQ
jgi:hypothetical protein